MSEHTTICVIGAGVVGSATAYSLSKSTKNVVLLEQFPLPHSRGSSHGQSRTVRYSYGQDIYAKMMPESFRLWREIENAVGEELLRTTGLLTVDSHPFDGIRLFKDILTGVGCSPDVLMPKELQSKYPMLKYSKNHGAILEKEGSIARADRCVKSLQKLFIANGGKLYEGTKVRQIIPGNPVTIVADGLTLSADKVIITAGPWTKQLLTPLGLDLPLQTAAISVCYWRTHDERFQSHNFPMFADVSASGPKQCAIYGFPSFEYPGMMKICNHHGQYALPEERDKVSSEKDIEEISSYIKEHFIGVETEPSVVEKCMYTLTPDDDFIIDTHPKYSNIIIGTGFSGHGFKMAPVLGKILAELALGYKCSYDISPFRISRFESIQAHL